MSGAPVAIAVVNTNMRDLLEPCLRSMHREAEEGRAEVWVVDNASSDGSPELVRERYGWVNLIASPTNLGYGRAINLVADRTTAPWLAAANEDIELRAGALERLLRTGEEHPDTAVVAPLLELPDGSPQHSAFSFPTIALTAYANLGLYRLNRRLADRLCIEGRWDPFRPRTVPWAIATFTLLRREAFDAVGRFSNDQFMYADDLDLGWRLHKAGWKARYEPRARVFHVGHAAGRKAFGDSRRDRWVASSYCWQARRMGLVRTRLIAGLNLSGAALRFAWYSALAAAAPARFGPRRDGARGWLHAHRFGLRPREELLQEL